MQEEGWAGEWRRVSAVTLFMSFTPIGLTLPFVSASVHNVTGTGRFPQLRDAIGWAEVRRSSGWWIIISSIQKWGVMGKWATFFFLSPMSREKSNRVIYNVIQGSWRTSLLEYNVTSDIKTPNPLHISNIYSNHYGTAGGVYIIGRASHYNLLSWSDTEQGSILLPCSNVLLCVTAWPLTVYMCW